MISSYGTISARLGNSDFVINPRDFNRRKMKSKDMVLVRDGKHEKGKRPSKAMKLHDKIYTRHPWVQCIISTQSPCATAFCVAKRQMDTRTIPESYILLEDIPLVPYESQYGREHTIVEKLNKHVPIVLVENDSILVTGKSILETFDRLEVAEFSARSLIDSTFLGEMQPIRQKELNALKEKFFED